jgi:hypothetical protein
LQASSDRSSPAHPSIVRPELNVQLTKGDGTTQDLGRVNSAADCVPGAWYYDNNTNPTKIMLCPIRVTRPR